MRWKLLHSAIGHGDVMTYNQNGLCCDLTRFMGWHKRPLCYCWSSTLTLVPCWTGWLTAATPPHLRSLMAALMPLPRSSQPGNYSFIYLLEFFFTNLWYYYNTYAWWPLSTKNISNLFILAMDPHLHHLISYNRFAVYWCRYIASGELLL